MKSEDKKAAIAAYKKREAELKAQNGPAAQGAA